MGSVLVVDDEEGIRSFLVDALGDDHRVAEAGDVDSALELCARERFHVVLTDLRMKGRDGMELVRALRAEQPEVEVVVLTAHGDVETAVEAMKLGAFDYLQKPVGSPAELRLLVRRALEHHRVAAGREVSRRASVPPLSFGAPAMDPVVRALRRVAQTDSTVLLLGESGTGKEVAARTIHELSRRCEGPFVAISCAAISETLLESELFGHEKGAFTGAGERRRGRIELADGGTFFLDEVGELKPSLQAKLLRVLQSRRFERVGGAQTVEVDVRWIAATNRDLAAMMADGDLRQDLYHRLAVFPIRLPPLRERREDIAQLADALLATVAAEVGRPGLVLNDAARERLAGASWPGNVRELRNTLERTAILVDGTTIGPSDIAFLAAPVPGAAPVAPEGGPPPTMEEVERRAIELALTHAGGNRRLAAEHLGIGLRTLYEKIKRYGLS